MRRILAIVIGILIVSQWAVAEETIGEKTQKTGNDAKRGIKKGAHRTEEAVKSVDQDAKNRAKVKNRAQETEDRVDDKAKEIKNKVD